MTTSDAESLTAAEREHWNSVAGAWRKWWRVMEDGAQPVNDRLVELAGVEAGHHVLDVACGIGEPSLTAARRAGPTGRLVGIDLSPAMLAFARERAAETGVETTEYREADAAHVPLPAETFDAGVSRWGVMLMAEPAAAMRNIHAALKPGARFAAAVWGRPQASPILSLARGVLESEFGVEAADPDAPGPFRLHRPGQLAALFTEAGFADLQEDVVTLAFQFTGRAEYLQWVGEMSSSLRQTLAELTEAERERYWQLLDAAARERESAGGPLELGGEVICLVGAR